jgi:hypothetical protein
MKWDQLQSLGGFIVESRTAGEALLLSRPEIAVCDL